MVLMATAVDGAHGVSDGGICMHSRVGTRLLQGTLELPPTGNPPEPDAATPGNKGTFHLNSKTF